MRYRIKPDPDNIYVNGSLVKYGYEVRNDLRAQKQLGIELDDEDEITGEFESGDDAIEVFDEVDDFLDEILGEI